MNASLSFGNRWFVLLALAATLIAALGIVASPTQAAPPAQAHGGIIFCGDIFVDTISAQTGAHWWTFSALANTDVTVAMDVVGGPLDPMLYILGPSGQDLGSDDDSGGGLNAFVSFTVPEDGEVVIIADYVTDPDGDYLLTLTCSLVGNPAQPPAPPAQPGGGLIACGQTVTGYVSEQTGWQVWTTDLLGNTDITVSMDAINGNLDSYLQVIGPSGVDLATDDDSGGNLNALVNTTVPQNGTVTIVANFSAATSGDYALTLLCSALGQPPAPPAQPNSGIGRTESVICGSEMFGSLTTTVWEDHYVFHANVGETLFVSMDVMAGGIDPYLSLWVNGAEVMADDDSGGNFNAYVTYSVPATEAITIVATRVGTAQGQPGDYRLYVNCAVPGNAQPPAQPGNPPAQPPAVPLPQPGSYVYPNHNGPLGVGNLAPIYCGQTVGDAIDNSLWYDAWYFSAAAGETVVVTSWALGGNLDPHVDLLDPTGTWVAADNDSGGGIAARLIYNIPTTGWYTIRAGRAGGQNAVTSGAYNLSLQCGSSTHPAPMGDFRPTGPGPITYPGPNYPAWVVDQGIVACMDMQVGAVNNQGWYYEYWFEGVESQQVSFSMTATSGNLDPYMVIILPDGTFLDNDDVGPTQDSQVDLVLPYTGIYRVQVSRFGLGMGQSSGDFRLDIQCLSGGNPAP